MYHYAAAPVYAPPIHSTYGDGYSKGGYHRRSTDEARNLESPSNFQFLSKMVTDAIGKYTEVDQAEE